MPCSLQIQIGVGKTLEHQCSRATCRLVAARIHGGSRPPRALFEGLMRPGCLLNWRNVLSSLVVARAMSAMQRIEFLKLRFPRCIQDLHQMRNTLVGFSDGLQAIPYFAALGNEVVVRI